MRGDVVASLKTGASKPYPNEPEVERRSGRSGVLQGSTSVAIFECIRGRAGTVNVAFAVEPEIESDSIRNIFGVGVLKVVDSTRHYRRGLWLESRQIEGSTPLSIDEEFVR